jgi:transcriptional regulator with XRE-family HTH domain
MSDESFKKERLRLKLSQAFVAEECGVTTRTVIRWEQGNPIPSDKLAVLVTLGFDVQYIVAGVRSTNAPASQAADSLDARMAKLSETQRDVVKMMVEELERAAERERLAKELASKVRQNGKKE